jgi:hypothetical protein
MAKKVDTRNAEGRGITYTEYDTKVVDWAKAPKTSLDAKWKIPDVQQIGKPGEVKYYGAEFADEAKALNEKRYAAYNRRQSNEYIRAGARAPEEKINTAAVEGKVLQQAKVEYGGAREGKGRGGIDTAANTGTSTFTVDSADRQFIKPSSSSGVVAGSFITATAKGAPFRQNAGSFKTATLATSNKDDEGLG